MHDMYCIQQILVEEQAHNCYTWGYGEDTLQKIFFFLYFKDFIL